MREAIEAAIERQARKLIERKNRARFAAEKYQRRYRLRTGNTPYPGTDRAPGIWNINPHFDPVHCIRHSRYIAKTIWQKIQAREYSVGPAVQFKIPKDSGGHREIMVFSIPDAAVANVFNRKLRDRNRNLQSPFCYSYRKDRTIFDAVLHTASLLEGEKVYVTQYDFAKYFDSIKHEYIDFLLESDHFFVSPMEKFVIGEFLKHRYSSRKDYGTAPFQQRKVGVPQGCSLSLFLSNIAAHELDRTLERGNGSFVRFADDIVCVTREYDDASRIAEAFREHCHYTGITINFEKSPGICFLRGSRKGEDREFFLDKGDLGKIKSLAEFDYIGHKFTKDHVRISSRGIQRIKRKIGKIIYVHLLSNLRRGEFSHARVGAGFYDWDLVTCVNELKSYIYGGLKERRLVAFLEENKRVKRFKGLMSFYPLVTTVEQFSTLDGWLVSVLRRAIKERAKLIHEKFGLTLRPLKEQEVINGEWYQFGKGIQLETRAPSFALAWRAARKAFKQYGLTDFEVPTYYSSLFESYD